MKHILLLLTFAFIGGSGFSQASSNLISHYKFDGNANDNGSLGVNGTVSGANLVADRCNNPNSAYSFDGIYDEIRLSTSIDDSLYNGTTFSAWIYVDEQGTGGRILSNYNGPGVPGNCFERVGLVFQVHEVNQQMRLNFYFHEDGNDYIGRRTALGSIESGVWTHVMGTWTGDISSPSEFALYINGVKSDVTDIYEGDIICGYMESLNEFTIGMGSCSTGPCAGFDGMIDDVRIYSKVLTSPEIIQVYLEDCDSINTSISESEKVEVESLKFYPNPAAKQFTFSNQEEILVKVYDLQGREILVSELGPKGMLNVESISEGAYMMYILPLNNEPAQVERLIIAH